MTKVCRDKKGQFLVASALLIAILFIAVTSVLTSTTITNVKLLKDDFQKDAMQIISNFRGALTSTIVDVSSELEHRSRLFDYNYTTLEEYPEAETYGIKMMINWQNTILQQYAGRALNLSITNQTFECEWNSTEFYSKTSAVMTLDILTYGFYGLKQNVTSELRLQFLNNKTHGNEVTLIIKLQKEKGLPVTDLKPSFVTIFYNDTTSFTEAEPSTIGVKYLGNGVYNVTFSAIGHASRIKMILRDGRGIVVAAIPKGNTTTLGGVSLIDNEDKIGPITTNVLANPNPCPKQSTTKLIATVDDTLTGANIIFKAEYFIGTKGGNGSGTNMTLSDGCANSPKENFMANVSGLAPGNYTIYVHGMDAVGNWGNFSSVVLQVKDEVIDRTMHVFDIKVDRDPPWGGFWGRGVATVTVVDAKGNPVPWAKVYGKWSGSVSSDRWGDTGPDGKAKIYSEYIQVWGWWGRLKFTFTVKNIVKAGWTYDPFLNVKNSSTYPPP